MDFPDWEKPWAANPARYASQWADDLGVPRDTHAWQEQYAQNLRDLRARAAQLAAGLHGLPAGAGDAAQVTAMGTRKAAGTEVDFVHYDCGNGLGAVVIRGGLSYGRQDGLWEAALARTAPDGTPQQPAPGTARELLGWADDVLGRLTPQDVKKLLQEITALLPQAAPAAGQKPGNRRQRIHDRMTRLAAQHAASAYPGAMDGDTPAQLWALLADAALAYQVEVLAMISVPGRARRPAPGRAARDALTEDARDILLTGLTSSLDDRDMEAEAEDRGESWPGTAPVNSWFAWRAAGRGEPQL